MAQARATTPDIRARGPLLLAAIGVLAFGLAWRLNGEESGYWLPGLGLGMALLSWFGWRIFPVLAGVLLLVRCASFEQGGPFTLIVVNVFLHLAHISAAWWLYDQVAQGARGLDDPRSATVFLLLGPGILAGASALMQAFLWCAWHEQLPTFTALAAQLFLSRAVGVVVVYPVLIVLATPVFLRYHLVDLDLPPAFFSGSDEGGARYGDRVELIGLTFATSLLAILLPWADAINWVLWGACLILIVWTCIRQGLRGGCFAASVASVALLIVAQMIPVPEGTQRPLMQSSIQGHLLAFCSTALLLGVSASWIRANETRYRHVVNRVPFVLYSVRLPYGIPSLSSPEQAAPRKESKADLQTGPAISQLARVVLVSPACTNVFHCDADTLIGPFALWLDMIEPEDRELVVASLAQLCLQKQPVTCEYRLRGSAAESPSEKSTPGKPRSDPVVVFRWVRDTLTPHYADDGLVDGWEGLVEDITDQRVLSHNLRKMTNMLQVLVANLPTGVYFVQAPTGFPLLVNARARQLLGQREDLSAGLPMLSKIYRLYRPDGSEYPWEELPVCKALRNGVACQASDIVVHRSDGRKIPLIAWAAPVDLHNTGTPDAAVWVLEDWSAMQQAEVLVRESELRLRAVIETMSEGVLVHDAAGAILDCNPAACAILDVTREALLQRAGLMPDGACVFQDGSPVPRAEQPDQQAVKLHQPVRGVILGMGAAKCDATRWLLVNSVPLPVGVPGGLNPQKARVVTTFADITQQLQAQESLRLAKDKYQSLVETIPFMLLQRDRDFNITYINFAATQLTGYPAEEMLKPNFCESIIHPDDLPKYFAAAESVAQGKSARIEVRFRAKDQSLKTVLAFIHPNIQNGAVVGSTSLVVDMTMQRRLEEELQQAKHLELVGRLASGTVHDFNNLLQVLLGLAGLAKYEVAEDHAVWQHLVRIEEAGEQAAHLAGQLLTFSKQRPRQTRAVDLNAMISQTLKLARSVMPADIAFEANLDPALPLAQGDEVPFKQVLMNLCINARDAMPRGGRITITTDLVKPAPEPSSNGVRWVHLAVQDTGHGMEEPVRMRIFEPFFSTKERGTGLGLAVVAQIIKEFGGKIEVASKPGEGTRFDIWFAPAKSEQAVAL